MPVDFFLKPRCCPPKPLKKNIYNPEVLSKFPLNIRIAHQIVASVGTHNQCYTRLSVPLNAYGKWAGAPGGSGPGVSSTMNYVPYTNSSGLGPMIGGAVCNCSYQGNTNIPFNIVTPLIYGNIIVGSTLTSTTGTWGGYPAPTLTYQWYRGAVAIPSATNNTYVIQVADSGQSITCHVTGTNTNGFATAISNNSISPTSPPGINNNDTPQISGNALVGSTLTLTNVGTWSGYPTPTLTYQWYREDTPIPSATNNTYITQAADAGYSITCHVSGVSTSGSAVAISTSITPTSPPQGAAPPQISGNALVGSTLTTTNGSWSGYPTPTFTYQWYRGYTLIPSATSNTYVTQADDVGQSITCVVTATNTSGWNGAQSNNWITPTNPPTSPPQGAAPPQISGNALVGSTLTTTNGSWTGYPAPTFTYQWYRGYTLIPSATSNTYVTQDADVGQSITCVVTATNTSGWNGAQSNNSISPYI